ncbi:methylated-DNA--[protein]-cysteine S-methyltransferase [Phocicoccus pinnipedialis]|uniref:Methylated-DNA--protein-cysteine methyltransferase n=1 Tax=Phocicoccus pinnipedialis TaxID=110845 RepID=A0A6V7RCG7_9BACL|nr:methylated-DNA--[protein]-cysteine S-methyltransferase [Jeotgalicoccus pinnipedialis]MBP1939561.1 methylated-DNA-[protein]-cysteine S-methyltransferase [Jeotgalicoccus pinnipedialis]CAD2074949.1 Methylated-DNA--protein-cysteine methyltransferase [Jeotgalicoccus pinnipedialis]
MKAVKQFTAGNYEIESKDGAIIWIKRTENNPTDDTDEVIEECAKQLNEYFEGKRRAFDFPINYDYGTPFQQEVWDALRQIPYGEVISYKELAKRVRTEKHSRAVANANGKNPLSIIVPCHRVIESSGGLGGYSSGLDMKRHLLNLEDIELQK